MWVTQREDSIVNSRLTDQQALLGILAALAACFSPVKARRQPVFSLLPQFGHFVSGAFLLSLRDSLSLPWLCTRTSYLSVFGLVPPMWLKGESSVTWGLETAEAAWHLQRDGKMFFKKIPTFVSLLLMNGLTSIQLCAVHSFGPCTQFYELILHCRLFQTTQTPWTYHKCGPPTFSDSQFYVTARQGIFKKKYKIKSDCTISYYISTRLLSAHMIVCVYMEPTSDCTHRFFSVSGESVQARCCIKANFTFWG